MGTVHKFTVVPKLPDRLKNLKELAYNLSWTWNNNVIDLFRRLDADLWEDTGHNPVLTLGSIQQRKLAEAAADDSFLAHMDRVWEGLEGYLESSSWYGKYCEATDVCVAYFSAEFGITECMPFYSGGLGVLSGDHLKAASDLDIPIVGVGLLYQQGYFNQYMNADGWQQESYPDCDFYNLPVRLEKDEAGNPMKIQVDYPAGAVVAQVWRAQVGRVPLYLLDTNIPENVNPRDRDITDRLYGGDQDYRVRQEIMMGIGGLRALEALGIRPNVYHMNEGHSAFLVLERIKRMMSEHNLTFAEAHEVVLATNVFTTHTSVPAGIDIFPYDLIDKYFSNYYKEVGISKDEFFSMGDRYRGKENFCMPALALSSSTFVNGVSRIHAGISRNIWKDVWTQIPEHEVPISSVNNGIHMRSWISKDMTALFDRYLGPKWAEMLPTGEIWDRIHKVPDEELWRTHERRRERTVAYARRRLREQLEQKGAVRAEIEASDAALDPSALTIGFARRFATYKRADLLLADPDRLARIVSDEERPVQIIYAGKAHPQDDEAKNILRKIVHLSRHEPFRGRIVFLEDYSLCICRYLVQGVDLWLNTPRRPNEACGTSGMKAASNGAINMSILDGWWDEAYRLDIGWAIGQREVYEDPNYQDMVEGSAIYEMLEQEIVPMFYERGRDKLPKQWIDRMKASMRAVCPVFSASRMVHEYFRRFYSPCAQVSNQLSADNFARARALAAWKSRILANWQDIKVGNVTSEADKLEAGSELRAQAEVYLGSLQPADVSVQVYYGPLDADGRISSGQGIEMKCAESRDDGNHIYEGSIPCVSSGVRGYSVRVLPMHEDLQNPYAMNLIKWH